MSELYRIPPQTSICVQRSSYFCKLPQITNTPLPIGLPLPNHRAMLLWDISWSAHKLELSAHPQPRAFLPLHCKEPPKLTAALKDTEKENPWMAQLLLDIFLLSPVQRKKTSPPRKGRQRLVKQHHQYCPVHLKTTADGDTHRTCYLAQRRKKCQKEPSGFASGALLSPWMLP